MGIRKEATLFPHMMLKEKFKQNTNFYEDIKLLIYVELQNSIMS